MCEFLHSEEIVVKEGDPIDIQVEEYYCVHTPICSYGGYETFDEAIEQSKKDGTIRSITKVTLISKVIWTKTDNEINKEEVLEQLETSLRFDDENYLSKEAIKWLLKKLRMREENEDEK